MRKNFDELGLLIVAILFGLSYSFQNMAAQYVKPFSFSLFKYFVGFMALLPFRFKKTNTDSKAELKYGIIISVILTIFSYLQQVVAVDTAPGKIGFITSMYIVEVPLLKLIFFKNKINLQTILSIILAVGGLVLLCDITELSFNFSDLLIIACSLLLAMQIITIERCCSNCNPFKLNFNVFLFNTIFSLIGVLVSHEHPSIESYKMALLPMLYSGIGCAAIGVTLQTYCQQTVNATTSALIMSLESVFSVIFGYLLLDEALGKIEIIGCILMFMGAVLSITAQNTKKE